MKKICRTVVAFSVAGCIASAAVEAVPHPKKPAPRPLGLHALPPAPPASHAGIHAAPPASVGILGLPAAGVDSAASFASDYAAYADLSADELWSRFARAEANKVLYSLKERAVHEEIKFHERQGIPYGGGFDASSEAYRRLGELKNQEYQLKVQKDEFEREKRLLDECLRLAGAKLGREELRYAWYENPTELSGTDDGELFAQSRELKLQEEQLELQKKTLEYQYQAGQLADDAFVAQCTEVVLQKERVRMERERIDVEREILAALPRR